MKFPRITFTKRQSHVELAYEAFNNMFGSLGGTMTPMPTGADFIPLDGEGGTLKLKGDGAQWKGLQTPTMQYWAYLFCSPLASVIDGFAELDTVGVVEILKDDKTKNYSKSDYSKRLLKLFSQPNPMQTWEEFRGEQKAFAKTFGYCPVWCIPRAGMDKSWTKYMWNLNPYYARPKRNMSFNLVSDGVSISGWTLTIAGRTYDIDSSEVFIIKDGNMQDATNELGLPTGKVAGLDFSISNICAAMEADNVLLRKKGPLGFLSHEPKPDPVSGNIPLDKDEKKELQDDLRKYGIMWSQLQHVVTRSPMKWNPMSFNIKDLATKETIRQAIDMICDRFRYPAELMSGKNATYENRNSSERYVYQNNIMPSACRDMRQYGRFFEVDNYGIKITMDFSDVAVLQEGRLAQGQAILYTTEALDVQWKAGLITLNQYRVELGRDTVPDDDIYYHDYIKLHPELNENKNANSKPSSKDISIAA